MKIPLWDASSIQVRAKLAVDSAVACSCTDFLSMKMNGLQDKNLGAQWTFQKIAFFIVGLLFLSLSYQK